MLVAVTTLACRTKSEDLTDVVPDLHTRLTTGYVELCRLRLSNLPLDPLRLDEATVGPDAAEVKACAQEIREGMVAGTLCQFLVGQGDAAGPFDSRDLDSCLEGFRVTDGRLRGEYRGRKIIVKLQ